MANNMENCIPCKQFNHWIEIRLVDEHAKPFKGKLNGTLKDNSGTSHTIIFQDGYLLQTGLSAGPVQIKLTTDELIKNVQQHTQRAAQEKNPVPELANKTKGYEGSKVKYQNITIGDICEWPSDSISKKNLPGEAGKKLVIIADNSYMLEVKSVGGKENIIIIGSEVHENGVFTHMMFIAAAVNKIKSGLRVADNNVVAIIDNGYTSLEINVLELYRDKFDLELILIKDMNQLIGLINRDRDNVKIQDLYFYAHGYPGTIDLNMDDFKKIKFNFEVVSKLNKNAFISNGIIHSFACRTGMEFDVRTLQKKQFSSDNEAAPSKSLAMQMAKYFKVEVRAFLTRTLYRSVVRDPSQDSLIESELKQQRNKNGNNKVYSILGAYEGLPHPGISDGILSFKAKFAGVDGYTIWPKQGGLAQPISADDIAGLTKGVRVFMQKGEWM